MLYTKKDIINAINGYIESLQDDIKREQNDTTKQVLTNVEMSLQIIVRTFRK